MESPIRNKTYKFKGVNQRLIAADLTYMAYKQPVPIAVFVHGFKGFKDWGAWPLASEIFALKGIPMLKFNFSHNGTTPSKPTEFVDLEAFANNNYKIEYDEVGMVFDFLDSKADQFDFEWNRAIYLIGHSRGGGIALLRAANDERVTKCATWAGLADLGRALQMKDTEEWLKDGKHEITNTRTGQVLPINFQFVASFRNNRELLDIDEAVDKITCPLLIVHGEDDETVPLSDAHKVFNAVEHAILLEVEGADHTFNTKHPLTERKISKAFAEAVSETIEFFHL